MKLFVTGASGFIGTAVVKELLDNGHEVLGLARSDESAEKLRLAGAEVHRGSLDDDDSLVAGANSADGVVHLAFNHDFVDMAAAAATDLHVVELFGTTLAGSDKVFVNTSGTLSLAFHDPALEDQAGQPGQGRVPSEDATTRMADGGVRSSLIRLSPTVHGESDHGFVARLASIAKDKGFSAYVGEGLTRWPAVHRLDAARLYRLAIESGEPGKRYHAAAEAGIAFIDIATALGERLGIPVRSIPIEEATPHFGFLGALVQLDNPTSSDWTRETLGWSPTGPTLAEDIAAGHYDV